MVGIRAVILGAIAWGLQACAPPALRAAHSIDKGEVAYEFGQSIDISSHQAKVLTLTGNDALPLQESATTHLMAVIGLGGGFEIGTGSSLMAKYSILDERRHDTPVSVAIAAQTPTFEFLGAGTHYDLSAGVLLSQHAQLGASVALRPVLNLMYSQRDYRSTATIPETLQDPDADVTEHGMWTQMNYRGIDIPVGFELPISVGDKLALAPTFSYTYSVPLEVEAGDFSCSGCAFALDVYEMGTPMRLWIGLKLQPKLRPVPRSSNEEL